MRPIAKVLALILLPSSFCFAQGPLPPPGAPAPTMKSLQEIWDKIGNLETQVGALLTLNEVLQTQHAALQSTVTGLQTQNQNLTNLLLSIGQTTGALPWGITFVDHAGNFGGFPSLAFTPGGNPAISYYDRNTTDLKYAVFNGSTWTTSTVDSGVVIQDDTSLAFTPGGQPAISYADSSSLRYAETRDRPCSYETRSATLAISR